jgi:hypothetical protein
MAQKHSAHRYAVVSLALVDNLITKLLDEGVISDEDKAAIIKNARAGLEMSANPDTRAAVELLDQFYKSPLMGKT